ncbi:MAG: hypothetical protein QXF17_02955 [Ignisphaera sp.]
MGLLFVKGQSDLITTVILVGVTIVIGVGFLSFVAPNISRVVGESNMKAVLYEEQSNIVVYKEFENATQLCIGLLRIAPGTTVYSIAILDENLNSIINTSHTNLVYFPPNPQPVATSRITPPKKVYYIAGGDYYPIPHEISVVYIPQNLTSNYIGKGRPLLLCIRKNSIPGDQMARIFILVSLNNNLYEVGRVYVSK